MLFPIVFVSCEILDDWTPVCFLDLCSTNSDICYLAIFAYLCSMNIHTTPVFMDLFMLSHVIHLSHDFNACCRVCLAQSFFFMTLNMLPCIVHFPYGSVSMMLISCLISSSIYGSAYFYLLFDAYVVFMLSFLKAYLYLATVPYVSHFIGVNLSCLDDVTFEPVILSVWRKTYLLAKGKKQVNSFAIASEDFISFVSPSILIRRPE